MSQYHCLHINEVMDSDFLGLTVFGDREGGLMCQVVVTRIPDHCMRPVLCQSGRLPRHLGSQLACLAQGQAVCLPGSNDCRLSLNVASVWTLITPLDRNF